MIIQSERLRIREYKESDFNDVYDIYKEEETCKYLLFDAWNESNKYDKFQIRLSNNSLEGKKPLCLGCELNNKVIGEVCLWYTDMKDSVEIGYAFNKDYTKKRYAYEAVKCVIEYLFNTLHVHRIQAVLDARNISSSNLCKKIGMRLEAHYIDDKWYKGEWSSTLVYGMLESDFNK